MESSKTHFGYQEVDEADKAGRVGQVFESVANRYDLMNDLMSLGIHRLWKRFTVFTAGLRPGDRVLDLAGGTGDLAALMAPRVGAQGRVVLSDINAPMLEVGRRRLVDRGIVGNVDYVLADAERLPFADDHFDCVTMAFGLRNVTRKERALEAIHRVLRPGGKVLVLEFSQVRGPLLRRLYDGYSFSVLPRLGRLVAQADQSYRYLAESIRMHPDQEGLKTMMEAAGFGRCDYHNLSAGVVAVHRGFKV